MNLYALFRLLWCPAKIRTPAGIVNILVFLVLAQLILLSVHRSQPDRAGAVAALLFLAFAGFVIGQVVGELELCSFSWTLPGLHRKLLSSVMLTGTVGALAAVGFHIALGGSHGPAIFGLAALGFSLGLAMATSFVLGDPSARFGPSSLLLSVAIVLIGVFIDRVAALCQAYPIPWFIVGVTIAGLYLWRRFDPLAAKTRLSPADSSSPLSSFRPRLVATAETSRPSWDRPYLGTSTANWIRAGEHENFGMKRHGLLRAMGWNALGGPIVVGGLAWMLGVAEESMFEPDQILYWFVFFPPDRPPSLPAFYYWFWSAWFGYLVAAFMFRPTVLLSISLRRGWLYPLSRIRLAEIAYWGGLMQSAAAFVLATILYCLLAVLSLSTAGRQFSYDFVPSFVLALALTFVLMPAAQWMSLKHLPQLTQAQKRFRVGQPIPFGPWLGTSTLLGLAVGTLLVLWRLWIPTTLFQGLIILTGLAVTSQWIYRHVVKAHFAHGDLVS
jgi:hypothetical protein